MTKSKRGLKFWTGNAFLAVSLAVLFFMEPISQLMGAWAMGLWILLAGIGFYLVTTDRSATINDID